MAKRSGRAGAKHPDGLRGDGRIAANTKAFHDYFIEERLEAGLVLTGTEIKAIRAGQVNLREGFARPQDGEVWLHNVHIAQYQGGQRYQHEPTRPRKLLFHKAQIRELAVKLRDGGLALVPLTLFIRGGRAKVEIALARGKRTYDKRETIRRREVDRELARAQRRGR